jgi:transcription antitermination factor NusG
MPYWCVARIASRLEALVIASLEAEGFEAFAPKIHSANRRVIPLFFGYLFVRVVELWQPIDRAHGVIGLIKFGDTPARCPDVEIMRLRSRMDANGFIVLPRPPGRSAFKAGDKIMIAKGPLAGLQGLHTGLSANERETVLLVLLGAQRRVAVPTSFVTVR